MPRLNPDSRGQIIGLLQANVSQRRLARQFNVSQSTISRLSRKFAVTGSTKDRPSRVTTRRQDNFIRQRHLRDRFTTAVSTAAGMRGRRGRNISRFTVSRRLKDYGIRCRRPVKGQILTRRHRQLRVRWATDMLRVRRQNWNRVVFSVESRFTLSFADGRLRVYRRRHKRFADSCVLERDRFGGGSVMVWGAISSGFRSDLIIVNGTLTARRYIDEILAPVLVPLLRRQVGNQQLTFQQDNARAHSARLTQDFLRAQGVDVMDWPAVSPDMNCIEHMWDELGRRLRKRLNQPNNVAELGRALQEEWRNIPMATVRRLVGSMRRRLQTVIQNNGGHCRYWKVWHFTSIPLFHHVTLPSQSAPCFFIIFCCETLSGC